MRPEEPMGGGAGSQENGPLTRTPWGWLGHQPGSEKPEPVSGGPARPVFGSPGARMALPATFRRGGRVKRTGWAKVHKGEVVVPAAAASMGAGKKKTRAKRKMAKTMGEWKAGTLHSGSKKGPVVRGQKQAVAISLAQASKA